MNESITVIKPERGVKRGRGELWNSMYPNVVKQDCICAHIKYKE